MEREHERSRREVEREMEIREMDAERFKQWKEQVIRSTYVILLLSIYHSGRKFSFGTSSIAFENSNKGWSSYGNRFTS